MRGAPQVMLAQADSCHIPLQDQSVDMVCTSPPYYNLRDYGIGADAGELGREPLHDCLGWATGQNCGKCYLCHLRAVARELWRVLRNHGTLWMVISDSYANDSKCGGMTGGKHALGVHGQPIGRQKRHTGLKSKDLCGIPQRLTLALQADGWYWRSQIVSVVELVCPCGCGYVLEERRIQHEPHPEIIWEKPSCMPSSVTDRPTTSHEYVLLLSKQARYFWDAEAIRESAQDWETRDRAAAKYNSDGFRALKAKNASSADTPHFLAFKSLEPFIERHLGDLQHHTGRSS